MANVLIPKKSTVAAKVPGTSDLALGEIAINHADAKLFARHPSTGIVQEIGGGGAGSITIDSTAADLFSASSGTFSADDLGSDKIYFWDDSAGRAQGLEIGTGLAISGTTLNNTGSLTGTGSVDNAILRADGTGGSTLQNSGLIVEDAVVPYTVTGDASTDIITATGHNFTANQGVMFPSLTGGSGLNTTTVYFVRDISGSTFKVSTTSGGAAVNFTTNITAGSVIAIQANVVISQNTTETNSALVMQPKGTGAFIIGPKPDGTATGGNARGANAVDLQTTRGNAARVASGQSSFTAGFDNTASGTYNISLGRQGNASGSQNAAVLGGEVNVASANFSTSAGGQNNTASGVYAGTFAGFRTVADRYSMQSHAAGRFAADGDAQRARFVLRCRTTTNSAVEMALDGGTTYLTIPSGKVIFCNIKVVGIRSDGSTVATYERQYAAKNVAGTSSEVFAPVTIGTDLASGTSLEVATVDAGDYIRIRPTGVASQTWRWVASVDAVEVAFGT